MREISWENYLRWALECCNESFSGNMSKFNQAMIKMIESNKKKPKVYIDNNLTNQ